MVQTCQAKTDHNEPFLIFKISFFAHPYPVILIKHNVKETDGKVNIWGEFYMPEVEGSGDDQRR